MKTGSRKRVSPPYLANNDSMNWADSRGRLHNHISLGVDDSLYISGHPEKNSIIFQAGPGNTNFQMTGTAIAMITVLGSGLRTKDPAP